MLLHKRVALSRLLCYKKYNIYLESHYSPPFFPLSSPLQPPRHVPNWYSTWQALDYQSACPQNLKYIGTSNGIRHIHEDCLYLNIFSPSVRLIDEAFRVLLSLAIPYLTEPNAAQHNFTKPYLSLPNLTFPYLTQPNVDKAFRVPLTSLPISYLTEPNPT